MSAGPFITAVYTSDNGTKLNARVQPETIAAWNTNPGGAVDLGISANMTGSFRQNGYNARRIFGRWVTAPLGYLTQGRVTVPILLLTDYNLIDKGDILPYLGGTFQVTGKRGESLV
jgi:hypothetical protein